MHPPLNHQDFHSSTRKVHYGFEVFKKGTDQILVSLSFDL